MSAIAQINSPAGDGFAELIERAVDRGVRKALNLSETTNRRMYSAEEAANFLGLSRREIYSMIARRELRSVKHGRRTMIDIQDLEEWIVRKKT